MGKRLSRSAAHDILQRCGIAKGADYHTLATDAVDKLISEADSHGYRKPTHANGSRGRYFHAYVQRTASASE